MGDKTTLKVNVNEWLQFYALFGEFSDGLFGYGGDPNTYTLDSDNRKKLEAFWPLKVGKKLTYKLEELARVDDTWNITLEVLKTDFVKLNGYEYVTFLIQEWGLSNRGKSFVGKNMVSPGLGFDH